MLQENDYKILKENMENTFNCSLERKGDEIIISISNVEYGVDVSTFPKCYYSTISNFVSLNKLEKKSVNLSIKYFKFLVKEIYKQL